jgi:hypothetical protein
MQHVSGSPHELSQPALRTLYRRKPDRPIAQARRTPLVVIRREHNSSTPQSTVHTDS